MLQKIKQILKIGIIESGQGSLRDNGPVGLIINILSCLVSTLLPFLLFYFKVFGESWGIIWYAHFAIFFELAGVMIADDRELTDYKSMSLFPMGMGQVLFLRFLRKFLNPISLISTSLFIASVFLGIKYEAKIPAYLVIICLIVSVIALLLICEVACLWKEKCGRKNIINIVATIIVIILGVLPFFLHGKASAVVILLQRCRGKTCWLSAIALVLALAAYITVGKIPQRFFDRFKSVKNEVSHFNLVCSAIHALPIKRQLKWLMIKDYKVMLRNNITLIINVVIWVLISWGITKIPLGQTSVYFKNEWLSLCYAGIIIQIYSTILQKPFAGDSFSGWITLLSPVDRKYILLSKDLVVLISNVFWFIPMSVFAFIISDDFTAEKCALWLVMYMCISFPLAMILNKSIVTLKMKMKTDGKKAILKAVGSFMLKMVLYIVVITISIIYQILMDSKYIHLIWFAVVPLCIIMIFIWAMSLEGQGKKINKYTQAITENLAISKG